MLRASVTTLLLGLGLLAASPLGAQTRADSGAFIIRLGTDTTAIERFVREGNTVRAEVINRPGRTTIRRYTLRLRDDGSLERLELTVHPPGAPPDAAPLIRRGVSLAGDSVAVETMQQGRTTATKSAARPGVIPLASPSYGIYEQVIRRLGAAPRATVPILGGGGLFDSHLRRVARDSVILDAEFETTLRVHTDAEGRILHARGAGDASAERVPWLDLEPLARDFAARDARGTGLGVLSPLDTTRAAVRGAGVSVEYSRPKLRGRRVFGGIEPWNQVWRTGANDATAITFERDVVIAGRTVPAGRYSLFTIPRPGRWTLILNRQTGMSGLERDPARDIGQFPMRVRRLGRPIEQLTILVQEQGRGGVLRILWENVEASVPFSIQGP